MPLGPVSLRCLSFLPMKTCETLSIAKARNSAHKGLKREGRRAGERELIGSNQKVEKQIPSGIAVSGDQIVSSDFDRAVFQFCFLLFCLDS